jgi:branched-subunit amino acid aminotransferase/4-amino-4-deoxychorismate lyase
LTDGDANLTEGSGFNVVLVKNGVLFTPDCGVLPGITPKSVVDVAKVLKLERRIEEVPTEMAYNCNEILICTMLAVSCPSRSLMVNP